MRRVVRLLALSVLCGTFVARGDTPDTRTRTWVWPTRMVWCTNAVDSALLVSPRYGQVPEGKFLEGSGCRLVKKDGDAVAAVLLDFGRELHGGLQIGNGNSTRKAAVRVRFGESVGEAMAELGDRNAGNDHAIRDSVIDLPWLGAREVGNTGFRFVRIDLVTPGTLSLQFVRAVSLMRPMPRLGAFRCSDERLNRIWETAVNTVHLCCQEYLWDGIKRDRLVWMGDTHPETRAILTAFGAARVLPETLDYAAETTDAKTSVMNGMPNYSLWWVRNLHDWYHFTGDKAYLAKHAQYLKTLVPRFVAAVGADGSQRWGGFLDWPSQHNSAAQQSGTCGLMKTTLENAAFLARGLGDAETEATCCEGLARLKRAKPDPNGSKQAAALLALAGLREPKEMYDEVLGKDGVNGVSTFYGYYMLEAMSAAGENAAALSTVRDYWGAMLDMGATSFWEDFNVAWTNNATRLDEMPVAGKKDIHGDFGEFCYTGYRHSLCHGWSSGPAAWLVNHVLGLRPTAVGCTAVEVKPFLGDLDWAEGALALPTGEAVKVRVEKRPDGSLKTTVDAPKGVKVTVSECPGSRS